ncbi:hypothetical protein SRHO_G00309970 [Serrasalmus rhombeus]
MGSPAANKAGSGVTFSQEATARQMEAKGRADKHTDKQQEEDAELSCLSIVVERTPMDLQFRPQQCALINLYGPDRGLRAPIAEKHALCGTCVDQDS